MIITELNLQIYYLLISSITTFFYIYNFNPTFLFYLIGSMCLFDLYYIKKSYDIILHHIFTLGLIFHVFNNPLSDDININNSINYSFLSSEVSTNFLLINNILRIYNHKSIINVINNILFISTFTYYRLYLYTYSVILNKQTNYIFLYNSNNNYEVIKIFLSMYGFYFLNIYWFYLIISKIYSKTIKNFK